MFIYALSLDIMEQKRHVPAGLSSRIGARCVWTNGRFNSMKDSRPSVSYIAMATLESRCLASYWISNTSNTATGEVLDKNSSNEPGKGRENRNATDYPSSLRLRREKRPMTTLLLSPTLAIHVPLNLAHIS